MSCRSWWNIEALFCAATSIFLQLYLYPAIHIFFSRSLFQVVALFHVASWTSCGVHCSACLVTLPFLLTGYLCCIILVLRLNSAVQSLKPFMHSCFVYCIVSEMQKIHKYRCFIAKVRSHLLSARWLQYTDGLVWYNTASLPCTDFTFFFSLDLRHAGALGCCHTDAGER